MGGAMIPVLARRYGREVESVHQSHPRPGGSVRWSGSLPLAEMDQLLKVLNSIWSIHKE